MMQGMPAPEAAWSPMTLSSTTTHSRGDTPKRCRHHHGKRPTQRPGALTRERESERAPGRW